MKKKLVYLFEEGNASMRNLLGGKGAGLSEMTSLGLPVPGGFIVTTEACLKYYEDKGKMSEDLISQIDEILEMFENKVNKKLGDPSSPLLLAIRSGARVSMPGMMDTVLNLGINDEIAKSLVELTGKERFVYDSYRRFIQMYSDVVSGLDRSNFEKMIYEVKDEKGVELDSDLDAEDFKKIITKFKNYYKKELGEEFPQDPKHQLYSSIESVFKSWNNPRAVYYRQLNHIPHEWGTAVNVQMMVFGNMGEDCATGVAFSRNPATGENKLFGEFLVDAQGEDVVAGTRTPLDISELKKIMPEMYEEFSTNSRNLEKYYKDMQDMEFTIENNKLYMLQTRSGKRTANAALKIACDMYEEGIITKEEALMQLDPKQLDNLLHPTFDPKALKEEKPIGKGLPASPGAAGGRVVFNAADAVEWKKRGEKIILVRLETSPEDIEGMHMSQGILTVRGGMTSHAAVVARGMGICCVAGCGDINMHEKEKYFTLNGNTVKEGDFISLDGSTGNIYLGEIPTVAATISGDFEKIMNWADEFRTLGVQANADSPRDAAQALKFGAEGIGLCRTEHMFFEADRIKAVREMIVAKTIEQRTKALDKILPVQRQDFEELFNVMGELPVTIRLLDPPLHEFLPQKDEEIKDLAKELGLSEIELREVITSLHEFNPMMGHRGCRLTVSYPEIAIMQTRAVIEAAINVKKTTNKDVKPEIMIPLVGELKELQYVKGYVEKEAQEIVKKSGINLNYKIGTMVELPRTCLLADEIAKEAEFFSFGTNDLTQMTYGFSRDDAGKFLDDYYQKKIFLTDPFATIDTAGVGKLVAMGVELGKKTNPELSIGVCGEHGGDPASVEFFHKAGLTYVSCSPYRVPIARLAAAQAKIRDKK